MAQIGYACSLYYNSAVYATPTWVEITKTRDATLNLERGKVDASSRAGNGWKEWLSALADASVDFQMVWEPTDAAFTAVSDAFFNNTEIELLVLDGDEATAGSSGLRALCKIGNFTRNEGLEETVTVDVSAFPTPSVNPPEWYTSA